ncbi:MAG: DNA methyltransferase [Gammaproteobacteria bacterium]|nr:DNA methyltransferase [Gammaproteobacteria bacterium]
MCFRYIGSKTRVVKAILERIGKPDGGTFYDAFSGTGAVARAASDAGWKVHVNDHLMSAAMMSFARITSSAQAAFIGTGGYSRAITKLNETDPISGFIWREYSPASAGHCGVARMYFTEDNAKRIDGVRARIERWREDGRINNAEACVLIADLIGAANRVANTAGTYGCFLSHWQRQSLSDMEIMAREMPSTAPAAKMTSGDVLDLCYQPNDTVYFDPPYTKRQYAAYYHILETIALGDEPTVEGVGGIRPWKQKASDYCYKARAAGALESLVEGCTARRVFLSYSTEGHVPLEVLANSLANIGKVRRHKLDQIGRYRPNRAASRAGSEVQEVLFEIEKEAVPRQLAA